MGSGRGVGVGGSAGAMNNAQHPSRRRAERQSIVLCGLDLHKAYCSKMESREGPGTLNARGPRSIYLASGLGFSARQRALVLPELKAALQAVGCDVYEPFVDSDEGAKTASQQGPGWAYRIGQSDFRAVRPSALLILFFLCASFSLLCHKGNLSSFTVF